MCVYARIIQDILGLSILPCSTHRLDMLHVYTGMYKIHNYGVHVYMYMYMYKQLICTRSCIHVVKPIER